LKKITLAAIVALGTATLTGMSAPPAAADNIRSVRVFEHGGFSYASYRFQRDRRDVRASRHGASRKFLKRVRNGRVVCFAKPSRRGADRFDRRGHRRPPARHAVLQERLSDGPNGIPQTRIPTTNCAKG
jgi:hypothetical protein